MATAASFFPPSPMLTMTLQQRSVFIFASNSFSAIPDGLREVLRLLQKECGPMAGAFRLPRLPPASVIRPSYDNMVVLIVFDEVASAQRSLSMTDLLLSHLVNTLTASADRVPMHNSLDYGSSECTRSHLYRGALVTGLSIRSSSEVALTNSASTETCIASFYHQHHHQLQQQPVSFPPHAAALPAPLPLPNEEDGTRSHSCRRAVGDCSSLQPRAYHRMDNNSLYKLSSSSSSCLSNQPAPLQSSASGWWWQRWFGSNTMHCTSRDAAGYTRNQLLPRGDINDTIRSNFYWYASNKPCSHEQLSMSHALPYTASARLWTLILSPLSTFEVDWQGARAAAAIGDAVVVDESRALLTLGSVHCRRSDMGCRVGNEWTRAEASDCGKTAVFASRAPYVHTDYYNNINNNYNNSSNNYIADKTVQKYQYNTNRTAPAYSINTNSDARCGLYNSIRIRGSQSAYDLVNKKTWQQGNDLEINRTDRCVAGSKHGREWYRASGACDYAKHDPYEQAVSQSLGSQTMKQPAVPSMSVSQTVAASSLGALGNAPQKTNATSLFGSFAMRWLGAATAQESDSTMVNVGKDVCDSKKMMQVQQSQQQTPFSMPVHSITSEDSVFSALFKKCKRYLSQGVVGDAGLNGDFSKSSERRNCPVNSTIEETNPTDETHFDPQYHTRKNDKMKKSSLHVAGRSVYTPRAGLPKTRQFNKNTKTVTSPYTAPHAALSQEPPLRRQRTDDVVSDSNVSAALLHASAADDHAQGTNKIEEGTKAASAKMTEKAITEGVMRPAWQSHVGRTADNVYYNVPSRVDHGLNALVSVQQAQPCFGVNDCDCNSSSAAVPTLPTDRRLLASLTLSNRQAAQTRSVGAYDNQEVSRHALTQLDDATCVQPTRAAGEASDVATGVPSVYATSANASLLSTASSRLPTALPAKKTAERLGDTNQAQILRNDVNGSGPGDCSRGDYNLPMKRQGATMKNSDDDNYKNVFKGKSINKSDELGSSDKSTTVPLTSSSWISSSTSTQSSLSKRHLRPGHARRTVCFKLPDESTQ